LNLRECVALTDAGLYSLSTLNTLTRLDVYGCDAITDTGVIGLLRSGYTFTDKYPFKIPLKIPLDIHGLTKCKGIDFNYELWYNEDEFFEDDDKENNEDIDNDLCMGEDDDDEDEDEDETLEEVSSVLSPNIAEPTQKDFDGGKHTKIRAIKGPRRREVVTLALIHESNDTHYCEVCEMPTKHIVATTRHGRGTKKKEEYCTIHWKVLHMLTSRLLMHPAEGLAQAIMLGRRSRQRVGGRK
jgi:hypothetical protein